MINTYKPLLVSEDNYNDFEYDDATFNYKKDLVAVDTYDPAVLIQDIEPLTEPLVTVRLENLKTGNKFIDAWFDVRIYTKNKEEYAYDYMYIGANSYFYLGFHARNTKRLPYNIRMTVGEDYISKYDLPMSERRYLVS